MIWERIKAGEYISGDFIIEREEAQYSDDTVNPGYPWGVFFKGEIIGNGETLKVAKLIAEKYAPGRNKLGKRRGAKAIYNRDLDSIYDELDAQVRAMESLEHVIKAIVGVMGDLTKAVGKQTSILESMKKEKK